MNDTMNCTNCNESADNCECPIDTSIGAPECWWIESENYDEELN